MRSIQTVILIMVFCMLAMSFTQTGHAFNCKDEPGFTAWVAAPYPEPVASGYQAHGKLSLQGKTNGSGVLLNGITCAESSAWQYGECPMEGCAAFDSTCAALYTGSKDGCERGYCDVSICF